MSVAGIWFKLQQCTNALVALDLIEQAKERGATQEDADEALTQWMQRRSEDVREIDCS